MYRPIPDFEYRPSADLQDVLESRHPTRGARALESLSASQSITDVEMRLKEVYIFDNRDPGKGDIYLVTVVTHDLSAEPFALEVRTFEDISDNQALPLGPAGLAIYRNPQGKLPRYLDYRLVVMESDERLRDRGVVLKEIGQDDQVKGLRDNLIAMALGAASPASALLRSAADVVVGAVARLLKMNRDDQIIYVAGSFNDKIDDLGTTYGLITHKNSYARVAYQVLAA